MSDPIRHRLRLLGALVALLASGAMLAGCASMGDTISPAFADPGKYEAWDCKQLEGERTKLAERTEKLQKLMDKAQTGVGGAVVAEMAYRNDYISVRGQAHFADEAWERNKCSQAAFAPAQPPAPGRPAAKSGSAVY